MLKKTYQSFGMMINVPNLTLFFHNFHDNFVERGLLSMVNKNWKNCVNTPYLTDDSYSPAPAGPAKRQKKTS